MSIRQEMCNYNPCFMEFLDAKYNGQKHMQAILMREVFKRLNERRAGIPADRPAHVLDVSSGTGAYTLQWIGGVKNSFPNGIAYHGTDFSDEYVTQTADAVRGAAAQLGVKGEPSCVKANLFGGSDALMADDARADMIHWSHSGYHVRDALGTEKNSPAAVEAGLKSAVKKAWNALDDKGVMVTIHQTNTQGSQMFSTAKKYSGVLDDVPAYIEREVTALGGHVKTLEFTTPLEFPILTPGQWENLKNPARWEDAARGYDMARALRLLSFVLYDFDGDSVSVMQRLANEGRLGAFIDEIKAAVQANEGHINVKCAFQLSSKSPELAKQLDGIVNDVQSHMQEYMTEMRHSMDEAGRTVGFARSAAGS